MAKSTKKRKKLSGNALKQKAYALLKNGTAKLVYAKGKGRSINTRYSKEKSRKMPKYVYVYELKPRKK